MNDSNPFASPQVDSERPVREDEIERPVVPYVSAHSLAVWTIGLIALAVLLDVVGAGSTYAEIQLLNRAASGVDIDPELASTNDWRQMAIGLVQMVVSLAAGICFLMWIYRAHRNLPALGARRLKYSPGWTVGYFFIPILNLFRPYQATAEIWRASDPSVMMSERSGWSEVPTPNILPLWWAFWLLATFVGQVAARMALQDAEVNELITASWTTLATDFFHGVAGVFLILVVQGIDRNQTEKAERLGVTSGRDIRSDDRITAELA